MTASVSHAETWDAIYRSGRAVREWPSEDVVRFCNRRLQQGMRVLEAGCGNGANLWFLADVGFDAFGYDASAEAVTAARRLCRNRADKAEASAHHGTMGELLRFPKGSEPPGTDVTIQRCAPYDAIIDCRASQHVPWSEHEAVYREYFDLLRPGGWLFLLHLDARTTDAHAKANQRLRCEAHTWSDIVDGVYPGNGMACMPPVAELFGLLRGKCGFQVVREERLLRETWVEGDARRLVASHVAFDARKPLAAD